MNFKNINQETRVTKSRKLKKRNFKQIYVLTLNSSFYSICIKYNVLKYFLLKQSIHLNRKLINQLFKEELGFIFSLNNWAIYYYKKNY